jgi:hypothetical protein
MTRPNTPMIVTSTLSRLALSAALSLLGAAALTAQPQSAVDGVLTRTAARIEQYFARAQSIVFFERTTVQPLRNDFGLDGFARVLESDLRVEWDPTATGPDAEAKVLRELRRVNGRPPRAIDNRNCLDPNPISPEPLAFLLPAERAEYTFSLAGRGKGKQLNTLMIDFRSLEQGKPEMKQQPGKDESCFSINIPGRIKGRVWVDSETYEVLRIDQQLTGRVDFKVPYEQIRKGMVDVLIIERYDTSIRYKPVTFHDPEETVLLPESIETLTIYRGAQSHRTVQVFSNYRRFMTGGRLVK